MKMNRIFKIMLAVVLLATLLGTCGTVFADVPTIPTATAPNGNAANDVSNILGNVMYVVQLVGMGVAVIMLIVLGIKFITASPDGKAEIKKSAWIYVVGAAGIFAASIIVNVLANFFAPSTAS